MKISVYNLESGMILNESVYTDNNLLLLDKGTVLNDRMIEVISQNSMIEVDIFDEKKEYGNIEKSEKKNIYNEVKTFDEFNEFDEFDEIKGLDKEEFDHEFKKTYVTSVDSYRNVYNKFKIGETVVFKEIENVLESINGEISSKENIARKLWLIEEFDYYTFEHSVRVSIMSGLIAKWMMKSEEDVKLCVMGGLLHDLGKCNIPEQILNKPGTFTRDEYNIMKSHPALGAILIAEMDELNPKITKAVIEHHERIDGTGYPFGLKNDEISEISKIVSVADVYCAMTANRIYKPAKLPFKVLGTISNEGKRILSLDVVNTFVNRISQYYVGTIVKLNDNRVGEIIFMDKRAPEKPIIRIDGEFFDMSQHRGSEIIDIIGFV